MQKITRLVAAVGVLAFVGSQASAATWQVDLLGRAGPGLLAGNETGAVVGTPGTGGEVGSGITFDDVTKILSINIGWGSAAGHTGSLTGNVTGLHIHGPASFTTNAGVLVGLDGLPGFNNLANGGGFSNSTNVVLSATNEARLFNGQLYINVHTSTNGGGELRGNLIVPEPAALTLLALSPLALRRRSR